VSSAEIGGKFAVSKPYTYLSAVLAEIEPPVDGTLSRAVYQDDRLKAVLFGFSPGQELSEHTASMPAIMHFLKGEATVTLGDDQIEVRAGSWIHMTAGLRHSIRTQSPVVMLLLLLK
jgi:quercetin dioxygenase-like cupin family protein